LGAGGDAVGNAGQPRQWTVASVEQAGVVEPPVQHGGSVVGAVDFFGVVYGIEVLVWVGAVGGEEQQIGPQGRPGRLEPR
jgi:hypothetical protein